jgi:anti-sigma factor RsiW
MSRTEREPTGDELLAMAYADGELAGDARRDFEARLAREPGLRREVAELRALDLLARQLAPPEPAELEWSRLESGFAQRTGNRIGLGLLGVGALLVVAGFLCWTCGRPLPMLLQAGGLCLVHGLVLLFALALRARLKLSPHDPYTKVKR